MCAEHGECERNTQYMIGSMGSEGHCRLACKNCTACPPNDDACLARSREEQGYIGDLEAELQELFS